MTQQDNYRAVQRLAEAIMCWNNMGRPFVYEGVIYSIRKLSSVRYSEKEQNFQRFVPIKCTGDPGRIANGRDADKISVICADISAATAVKLNILNDTEVVEISDKNNKKQVTQEVLFPATALVLPEWTFIRNKELRIADMSESQIPTISSLTFMYCPKLETVYFPRAATTIEEHVFQDCDVLKSIYLPSKSRAKIADKLHMRTKRTSVRMTRRHYYAD